MADPALARQTGHGPGPPAEATQGKTRSRTHTAMTKTGIGTTDTGGGEIDPQPLVVLSQAGDPEAFGRLIDLHATRLYRQAVALCGDETTAEDLVQQTLVAAWQSIARYQPTCRFSTWLYSILLHRHWKWLRAARHRPQVRTPLETPGKPAPREPPAAPGPTPAETVEQEEQRAWLREQVNQLPEIHRQVIGLRFFAEASLEEMAAALGCSTGTVKSRLHHALKKLRKLHDREGAAG